jgi:4-amino-4-deoxy-L-arabinose transferase-like glycosyltransferase
MQTSQPLSATEQTGASSQALALPRLSLVQLALWGLVGLGLLLRLWFLNLNVIDPRFSASDDGDYYQRALRFAVTGVYSDDSWLIRPPGHIFFFAGLMRLAITSGDPGLAVPLIRGAQLILSLLSILAGYGIARRLFNQRAGLLFAAILAVWLPFVELPALVLSEPLFFYCLIFQLWALVRWRDHRRLSDLALAGVFLGIASLARSPALYSAALALGFIVLEVSRRPNSESSTSVSRSSALGACLIAFLLPLILIVGPWTLRNYLVYNQLVLVDTLGPTNLLLSLADDSVAAKQAINALPQGERQAYISTEISRFLTEEPWRLTRNVVPHFLHIWKAQFIEDFFVKVSFYTRPVRELWPLGVASDLLWFGFTLAACFGLTSRPREGAFRLLALGWVVYAIVTVLLLHVEPRYLLPLYLFCGLYGAGWLSTLGNTFAPSRLRVSDFRIRDQRTRQSSVVGRWSSIPALTGGLLALGFVAIFFSYRDYPAIIGRGLERERYHTAGAEALRRGDIDAAVVQFSQMVNTHPEFIDGRSELANTLLSAGRAAEAWEAIGERRTHRSDVVRGAIARNLGNPEATDYFRAAEANAGEDIQQLTLNWLRPPAIGTLQLGNGLDLGYLQGFSQGEQLSLPDGSTLSYRWLAEAGLIRLPLAEPLAPGTTVTLRLTSGQAQAVPLTVRMAGETITLQVVAGQWRQYRLQVPEALNGQQQLELHLSAPPFIPLQNDPASTDARLLSIMVSQITVSTAQRAEGRPGNRDFSPHPNSRSLGEGWDEGTSHQ